MKEKTFNEYIDEIFDNDIIKIIVSNPTKTTKYKKIVVEKNVNGYYVSNYTDKQVFNENINISNDFDIYNELSALNPQKK